jgi:tRNA-specific 2-thiouridylase
MFPLGSTASKNDIRREADERGLSVANKPDSYDICFIPEGDTQDWLSEKVGKAPGQIVDREGHVLGDHEGTHEFTVGQRKGLSIGRPATDGKPRYVLEIRPKTNTVVVGPQAALAVAELGGSRYTWCGVAPESSESWTDIHVQVRAHGEAIEAEYKITNGDMNIRVKEPLLGVAPGQTAVLYLGTRVLGQMTIDSTVSAVPVGADSGVLG